MPAAQNSSNAEGALVLHRVSDYIQRGQNEQSAALTSGLVLRGEGLRMKGGGRSSASGGQSEAGCDPTLGCGQARSCAYSHTKKGARWAGEERCFGYKMEH